ncbi:hypothetical protein XA68_14410 [Ophiocordyceps unilateralis]|uniref:Uncharacterized protein n=1 Tax=Ophiocordyceps unilateralis TaxID=268505 RepID=A0A2A9PA90_OPHUN|nr:hypothetical protein XA68_14410 [Ophiocordyceps unilateralis]
MSRVFPAVIGSPPVGPGKPRHLRLPPLLSSPLFPLPLPPFCFTARFASFVFFSSLTSRPHSINNCSFSASYHQP